MFSLSPLLRVTMGRLMVILLILGATYPDLAFSSKPLLHSSFRAPDSYVLWCSSYAPEERVVQVHWKERLTNGTYSIIGVQNPNLGTHVLSPYKDEVKLNSSDRNYTLEIDEEKVVCCEMLTYPQGKVQETCLTMYEDGGTQRFHLELLVTLVLGGIFMLGSFIILCHIFWTRNGDVLKLRGGIAQEWRSRGQPVPYNGARFSRNLGYNNLSLANPISHETLPYRNVQHHQPPSQTNQLVPEVPPRRCQNQDVLSPNNRSSSENPSAPPNPQHPRTLLGGTRAAPSIPETINSKHQRKKPQVTEPWWSVPESTASFDCDVYAKPLWPFATACPEKVAPLQKSTSYPSSPLSTVNPMYHSRIQWMSHHMGSLRL